MESMWTPDLTAEHDNRVRSIDPYVDLGISRSPPTDLIRVRDDEADSARQWTVINRCRILRRPLAVAIRRGDAGTDNGTAPAATTPIPRPVAVSTRSLR